MRKINKEVKNKILRKTPWGHSATPANEGLNEEQVKGLFYKAITDEENSVISEINRIVDEANEQFSLIDNTEYFGKLENEPTFEHLQKWIRNGNLVYVYGNLTAISDTQRIALQQEITNLTANKSLVMKVTAPEGIIPDSSLKLKVGNNVYSGLGILKNSVDQAMNGIYFLRFAIPVNKIRKETVSVKWNAESREETVVFDFNDDYANSLEKTMYVKYATSSSGANMSNAWSSGKNYLGFCLATDEPMANQYKWVKIAQTCFNWSNAQFQAVQWTENKEIIISSSLVKANSIIFVEPIYSSYNEWHNSKIRLKNFSNGSFTLICDIIPAVPVTFRAVVGNQE